MALVLNSYSIAAFEEIRDISRDSTDVTRMYCDNKTTPQCLY